MLWLDQRARVAEFVAVPQGSVRRLHLPEPTEQFVEVSAGSVCEVAGAVGFTPSGAALICTASARGGRPRWRQAQIAA
jgi:hypothetical protein